MGLAVSETPVIADAKACEAWIARAALTDPRRACQELTTLLESLEEAPPREADYLDILERLREPIVIAQNEQAKKFATRPLPLRDADQAAFHQSVDLWNTLCRSYKALLQSAIDEQPGHTRSMLKGKGALLAQRALDCVVDLMLAYYRCRRELDAELWQDLHRLYALAEELNVARETVTVGRKRSSVSSPAEVYARAMLLALANPYAMGAREMNWLRRWSAKWAYKVEFQSAPPAGGAYAVDAQAEGAPQWLEAAPRAGLIFFAMDGLKRSMRGRIKKLEEGEDPETLGLGKDCMQPECSRLLQTLARGWTEQPSARQFNRRLAPGRTEVVSGMAAIHTAISGRAFKSAARHWDYSRRDAEQLMIYGVAGAEGTDSGFAAEKWETLDESATGFRLRRKGMGDRISHLQLVALKPAGGKVFILCEVRWLTVSVDESLTVGAFALPGLAEAVAVRAAAESDDAPEAYIQAFVLPESANNPASLILPVGWYQPGRQIEMRAGDVPMPVRLALLDHLRRGYDYDMATFCRVA